MAAIEDQNCTAWRNQVRECNLLAVLIWQREFGCFFSNAWGRSRSWQLPNQIEGAISEETKGEQTKQREDRSEDFASIELRFAKRADQTGDEQNSTDAEQQEIRPWEIARD